MIGTILVQGTGNEADEATLATALVLARPFNAHIDVLHVKVDPVEVAVTAASQGGAGGTLLEGLIEDLEQDIRAREAKARGLFSDFCTRNNLPIAGAPAAAAGRPSAEWHVEIGQEPRWMAAYGKAADLIVMSRGVPGDDAIARSTLEAVLLETGRALLLPGTAGPVPEAIDRAVIAWKPTPEAARAVAYAMPLLARTKEVAVVTVAEDEGGRDDADRLAGYLRWHGLNSVVERLTPDARGAAECLLDAASAKAGLLVMGGYGHGPLREWVFGGFTQRVLQDAPIAVLLAH